MKRSFCRLAIIAVTAVAFGVGSFCATRAEQTCPAGQCESQCSATNCCAKAGECDECPVAAAMKNLPQLTYAVGDEKTNCPNAAQKLAEQSGKPIHFVVAGKTYCEEAKAKLALVEETERFVSAFAEPKTCSVSGATMVAGKEFSCSVEAAQTAALVKEAMQKVKLTYVVGDKQCNCPVEAERVAEQTGVPSIYVVGKETTPCNITARLNLARAKYRAAIEALVQAKTKPQQVASDS